MMGSISEIYVEYVRTNLWWPFIAGLAYIFYRNRARVRKYQDAQSLPHWKAPLDPNPEYLLRVFKAAWRVIWPVWLWMFLFGSIMVIVDSILGPK